MPTGLVEENHATVDYIDNTADLENSSEAQVADQAVNSSSEPQNIVFDKGE